MTVSCQINNFNNARRAISFLEVVPSFATLSFPMIIGRNIRKDYSNIFNITSGNELNGNLIKGCYLSSYVSILNYLDLIGFLKSKGPTERLIEDSVCILGMLLSIYRFYVYLESFIGHYKNLGSHINKFEISVNPMLGKPHSNIVNEIIRGDGEKIKNTIEYYLLFLVSINIFFIFLISFIRRGLK